MTITSNDVGWLTARASFEDTKNVVEQNGIVGSVWLVPGRQNRAVLEFREELPKPGGGTNIVLTMADEQIVAAFAGPWSLGNG